MSLRGAHNGALLGHVQDDPEWRVYARAKDLVVGFLTIVGNYDYMFEWIFHQDGSFEFRAELLGLILNKTISGHYLQRLRRRSTRRSRCL